MMACKAALFSDAATLELILEENTKSNTNPKDIKALGRSISPFDEKTWVENREEVVYLGNLYKFEQDDELKKALLETGDLILVEASPRDRIWGIGFGEARAMSEKERWGLNLLGKALMRVREEFAGQEQEQDPEAETKL